ncbi:MAG: acyltransferase [Sphingobium sp.]|nr:acyltransferase [Sphingobium sp.]
MASVHSAPSQRLVSLQQLRGVAVLLVLILHVINVVDFRVFSGTDSAPGFISTWLNFNQFGSCGVDFFFVISGFVMALLLQGDGPPSQADFLYTRFVRIVPFFWTAALFYTLLSLAVGRNLPADQLLANILIVPHSLFRFDLPVLVVGWSLAFELAFYLLVASVLRLKRPATSLSLLLLFLVGLSVARRPPPGVLAIMENPIQLEFLWGIAAHWLWRRLSSRRISEVAATGLIVLGAWFLGLQVVNGLHFDVDAMLIVSGLTSLYRAVLWGLPCASIVLGAVLLEAKLSARGAVFRPFLRMTGDASYSLYLVHLPLCMLAETQLPANALQADLLIVALAIVCWGFGILVHRTLEVPMLKLLYQFRPGREGWKAILVPHASAVQ